MEAEYNDIVEWKFKDIPGVMGAKEGKTRTYQVSVKAELEKLLTEEEFGNFKGFQLVELHLGKRDAPKSLVLTAQASARTNSEDQ